MGLIPFLSPISIVQQVDHVVAVEPSEENSSNDESEGGDGRSRSGGTCWRYGPLQINGGEERRSRRLQRQKRGGRHQIVEHCCPKRHRPSHQGRSRTNCRIQRLYPRANGGKVLRR